RGDHQRHAFIVRGTAVFHVGQSLIQACLGVGRVRRERQSYTCPSPTCTDRRKGHRKVCRDWGMAAIGTEVGVIDLIVAFPDLRKIRRELRLSYRQSIATSALPQKSSTPSTIPKLCLGQQSERGTRHGTVGESCSSRHGKVCSRKADCDCPCIERA